MKWKWPRWTRPCSSCWYITIARMLIKVICLHLKTKFVWYGILFVLLLISIPLKTGYLLETFHDLGVSSFQTGIKWLYPSAYSFPPHLYKCRWFDPVACCLHGSCVWLSKSYLINISVIIHINNADVYGNLRTRLNW
jgi:hypothetical protein